MPGRKYLSSRHTIRSVSSEIDKLEKTRKSEIRMISTTASKFRNRYIRAEDPRIWQGETEACNVRMYETHFPGFCYRKDGKYRRKVLNTLQQKIADPIESSQKIKEMLFTNNEIDIRKVVCLHLLSTHVQSRKHIHRKDGRLCHYVKAPLQGCKHSSLQSATQRIANLDKAIPSKYDQYLPRYVLEVKVVDRITSSLSIHSFDYESFSDDESVRKRRPQIPIYINTDIRAIISSIIEALEAMNSPKLKELLSICQSPQELKALLSEEEVQEFLIELAGNQLVTTATAYEFIMTYPVLDKVPDNESIETIAHVLEFPSDMDVKNILHLVRKTITRRYDELVLCNVIPGKKKMFENRGSTTWNYSRASFTSSDSNVRMGDDRETSSDKLIPITSQRGPKSKILSQSLKHLLSQRKNTDSLHQIGEDFSNEDNAMGMLNIMNKNVSKCGRFQESEITRYDLKNLNNSQRIMLGLKIASMKCKPVNMHQFENRQKMDVASLISSIVRPLILDSLNNEYLIEDNAYLQEQRRMKRSLSRCTLNQVNGLANLNRDVLSNFRHDVATTENRKRVENFLRSEF